MFHRWRGAHALGSKPKYALQLFFAADAEVEKK